MKFALFEGQVFTAFEVSFIWELETEIEDDFTNQQNRESELAAGRRLSEPDRESGDGALIAKNHITL